MVGAFGTAVPFSVGRYGSAAYLAYTAAPESTYGGAGSIVLVLLWVYYSSLMLLFGAAFTKTYLQSAGRPLVPRNAAVRVQRAFVVEDDAVRSDDRTR